MLRARPLLFALVTAILLLTVADHLFSPPLIAATAADESACAPCGAPCPSTR
ncbi:MAG: hypothetical protein AB7L41_14280 [Flavobacteriaceae bacterium]